MRVSNPISPTQNIESNIFDENEEIMNNPSPLEPHHRTRGPNQGIQVPRDPSMRTLIGIRLGSFDNSTVSHKMGHVMRGHFNEPWPTWLTVPKHVKDLWWQHFKDLFTWQSINENVVYSCWRKTCRNVFNGMLSDGRKDALQLSGKSNLLECVEYHPSWMKKTIWIDLVRQFWSGDEWEKKSANGRKNRLSTKNGGISKHTCGSISAGAHHKKMEEECGEVPSLIALYNRMHKRNKGKGPFVDGKSKSVVDKYDEDMTRKYGSDESMKWDPSLWVQAVGGVTKGRVYGFGDRETAINILGGRTSSRWICDTLPSLEINGNIEQRIQEIVVEKCEENSRHIAEKIAEFERKQNEQQGERDQLLFASWFKFYFPDECMVGQMPPPPPPPPPPSSLV